MRRVGQFFAVVVIAFGASLLPAMSDESGQAITQPLCPVMEGNAVDESIHVDYRGKRVYFCCTFCKTAFQKEPGKYLAKLPQFRSAGDAPAATAHAHGDGSEMSAAGWRLYRFTGPLGIGTYSFLALTFSPALLRRKLKRRFLPIHRSLATATVIAATLHALTVLLGH